MGKMYSIEEVKLTREILNSIDYNKYGEVSHAFEKAYADGLFPNRSMTSVLSMASRIKTKMVEEAAQAEKARLEEEARKLEEEQIVFNTTVPISEALLRRLHEAEYKLKRLKEAIVDDAIGLTEREQLMYNFTSLHHALLDCFPQEYEAKLDELKAIYGR